MIKVAGATSHNADASHRSGLCHWRPAAEGNSGCLCAACPSLHAWHAPIAENAAACRLSAAGAAVQVAMSMAHTFGELLGSRLPRPVKVWVLDTLPGEVCPSHPLLVWLTAFLAVLIESTV